MASHLFNIYAEYIGFLEAVQQDSFRPSLCASALQNKFKQSLIELL